MARRKKPAPAATLVQADCRDWLEGLADKSADVAIMDPPYSAHVHDNARRNVGGIAEAMPLGYDALTPDLAAHVAIECARVVRRWSLFFCDLEGIDLWRRAITATDGLRFVRTMVFHKLNPMPQTTGDRPGAACEAIVVAHASGGRMRWNGKGRAGFYEHAIESEQHRIVKGQKPLGLLLDLVRDFTAPGELVIDGFSGAATTGVAALRLNRRFAGCEVSAATYRKARRRLAAEQVQVLPLSVDRGQLPLLGHASETEAAAAE